MAWAYQITVTYPTSVTPGYDSGNAQFVMLSRAMELENAGLASASTTTVITSDSYVQGLQIQRKFADLDTATMWQTLVDQNYPNLEHTCLIEPI